MKSRTMGWLVMFSLLGLPLATSSTLSEEKIVGCIELLNLSHSSDEFSIDEVRLAFHFFMHSTMPDDARRIIQQLQDRTGCVPADIQIQLASGDAEKLKQIAYKSKSPTAVTMACEAYEKSNPDGHKTWGYLSVLEQEPFWVPALIGVQRRASGNWLTASREGAVLLDLVGGVPEIAKQVMRFMPIPKDAREKDDVKSLAESVMSNLDQWLVAHGVKEKYAAQREHLRAGTLYASGRRAEAIDAYRAVLEHGAPVASVYYRLARLYEEQGRPEVAEATIRAGLEKFPERSSILLSTGAEYAAKKGHIEEATNLLARCLEASPEYPPAHILLANIEAQRGNHDAAIRACADALAYSYGWDGDYVDRVSKILQLLGRLKNRYTE